MRRTMLLAMASIAGGAALIMSWAWTSPALAAIDAQRSVNTTASVRYYCLYEPTGLPANAHTVVFFHGSGGNCWHTLANVWRAKARASGFRLVLPLGTWGDWNACTEPPAACVTPRGYAEANNTDDVAFFDALVAGVLGGRAYVVGLSRGGLMVHHLLCLRPDDLTGAAVVAGSVASQHCRGNGGAVPLLTLHGDKDAVIPWATGLPTDYILATTAAGAQAWRNGCNFIGQEVVDETRDAVSRAYRDCDVPTVEWLYNCQHGWPGLMSAGVFWWIGVGCTASFRAEDVIWRFFEGL